MKKQAKAWMGCGVAAALLAGLAVPHAQAFLQIGEFDEAEVFFEENTTDGDLGMHLFLDGDAWSRVLLFTSKGRLIVNASVRGSLGKIGLTELFSESAEPGFDELPRQDFLNTFPEGEYTWVGITLEGDFLIGETELTKKIPEGPEITLAPRTDVILDFEVAVRTACKRLAGFRGSRCTGCKRSARNSR